MKINLATDDLGAQRLAEANRKRTIVEKVVATVAPLHALRKDAVTKPGLIGRREHVVMARAHAAYLLNAEGLKDGEIARALNCDRSAALRSRRRWSDHLNNRRRSVTETEAWRVMSLVEGGKSVPAACDEVGVGVSKYEARVATMRGEGKLS